MENGKFFKHLIKSCTKYLFHFSFNNRPTTNYRYFIEYSNCTYFTAFIDFVDSSEAMCAIFQRKVSFPWWSICTAQPSTKILFKSSSIPWYRELRSNSVLKDKSNLYIPMNTLENLYIGT